MGVDLLPDIVPENDECYGRQDRDSEPKQATGHGHCTSENPGLRFQAAKSTQLVQLGRIIQNLRHIR
jgi:hypothetical protein